MARSAAGCAAALILSGCQAPYVIKSAWSQMSLLNSRVPIEKTLAKTDLDAGVRRKLELAQKAKLFAEDTLGLKKTKNYLTYVELDRPYVSYVVSAAPKDRLEHHEWWFPFIGSVPYKGYFNPDDAKSEAKDLEAKGLDVFVRGVSAYSTLGWFNDPILSSMLRYSDYDLANTIIHETTHATLYIKSNADFNERLASFIGNIGADLFFTAIEGPSSSTVASARLEAEDEKLFSEFISRRIQTLKEWYESLRPTPAAESEEFLKKRQEKFRELSQGFETELAPKLQSERLRERLRSELNPDSLNNARLLLWKLYYYDLDDFERAYEKLGRDPKKFIEFAKTLESSKDPEVELRRFADENSKSSAK